MTDLYGLDLQISSFTSYNINVQAASEQLFFFFLIKMSNLQFAQDSEKIMETPRRFLIAFLSKSQKFNDNLHVQEKITPFFLLLHRIIQVRSDRSYLINQPNISYEAKERALRKAQEIESQLDPTFPSFVRSMLHSHVTRGFWFVCNHKFNFDSNQQPYSP